MATIIRDEFVNKSGGFLGVITIDARGDRKSVSVPPGESVWLSEEEQIATANAPRADADNPLTNGNLELRTSGAEVKNRRPLRPADEEASSPITPRDDAPKPPPAAEEEQETGATPEPAGESEEGEFAPGEEVATPEAAEAPKPARRRRATAAA